MKAVILIVLPILFGFPAAEDHLPLDPPARKKFDNAIRSAFGVEDFSLTIHGNSVPPDAPGADEINGLTYQVRSGGQLKGYAYLTHGMGRYEAFDFVVLYSTDLQIQKVDILVYRSDHGYEIMNKRWLAQFNGKTGCNLVYGKDIDAISGATLSGTSLTETIAENCELMKLNANFDPR
jgi:hypothetical protein